MDGRGTGATRRRHDRGDAQVGLGCGCGTDPDRLVGIAHMSRVAVGVAVDGDGSDPQVPQVRMTRTAISPRFATRTVSNKAGLSHAEHTAGDRFQRRKGADAQRQADDPPRVRGIDHAVVPQPGSGVVGAALGFVGLTDGVELVLRLDGPVLAAGLVLFCGARSPAPRRPVRRP